VCCGWRTPPTTHSDQTVGISKERVGYILPEELDMKKLCARWVTRLLTADQKRTRTNISEQCLERFNKNKNDFVRRFITTDETWIQNCTPESK
jgi:histone-lysine N-methyltransferase SETMAR